MIVISYRHQYGIAFPRHEENAPLQANAEFEILADFTDAQPGMNMWLTKGFWKQSSSGSDFCLYFGV